MTVIKKRCRQSQHRQLFTVVIMKWSLLKGKPADPPTLQSSTGTGATAGIERRSTCSHDFVSEHKIICVYLELRSENQSLIKSHGRRNKIKNFQDVIARYYMESLRQSRRPSCWRQDEWQSHHWEHRQSRTSPPFFPPSFLGPCTEGLWTLC